MKGLEARFSYKGSGGETWETASWNIEDSSAKLATKRWWLIVHINVKKFRALVMEVANNQGEWFPTFDTYGFLHVNPKDVHSGRIFLTDLKGEEAEKEWFVHS